MEKENDNMNVVSLLIQLLAVCPALYDELEELLENYTLSKDENKDTVFYNDLNVILSSAGYIFSMFIQGISFIAQNPPKPLVKEVEYDQWNESAKTFIDNYMKQTNNDQKEQQGTIETIACINQNAKA